MKVLITGMGGFVGRHLAALLRRRGFSPYPFDLTEECGLGQPGDLREAETVRKVIAQLQPDRIYHLAAQSSVSRAWKDPTLTWAVNVEGTRNLLEALHRAASSARLLLVSSGAVYGSPPHPCQLCREEDEPRPANPYTESKLAAEKLALQYAERYGMDVRIVRPLGHTGPGQPRGFVVPDLAAQIAAIAAGQAPLRLRVGNLLSAREFADVRDVVRAYEMIMEQGEPSGIYNLASNELHTIQEVAETLLDLAGIQAELIPDPDLFRPSDESSPRLDTSRLRVLGFSHEIPFPQTLADVLAEWQEKIRS